MVPVRTGGERRVRAPAGWALDELFGDLVRLLPLPLDLLTMAPR